jgi:hypothetical protein
MCYFLTTMEKRLEYFIQQEHDDFKELFFKKLESITENSIIMDILQITKNENSNKPVDVSKYIETQLYNINCKDYMIDTTNGIVFSGKRADIVEILSQDELKKLKEKF